MATNLRLGPEATAALRAEAERSGRSQQAVIREAVDRHLGLAPVSELEHQFESLIATPTLPSPQTAYRSAAKRLSLPAGMSSSELIDRVERL